MNTTISELLAFVFIILPFLIIAAVIALIEAPARYIRSGFWRHRWVTLSEGCKQCSRCGIRRIYWDGGPFSGPGWGPDVVGDCVTSNNDVAGVTTSGSDVK